MIYKIIVLAVTLISCAHAATDTSLLAELPLDARNAVIKWNFKFKPYELNDFAPEVREIFDDVKRSAPMKLVADFNGDKIDDYALLGESEKQQYLIAVVSGKEWKVIQVKNWSEAGFKTSPVSGRNSTQTGVPVYLFKAAGELPESYAKKNGRELIQLEVYLGPVELFKVTGNKAEVVKQ